MAIDTSRVHESNPYDTQAVLEAAEVDTNDVYASKGKSLFALPRVVWTALVYPLGAFTIYAEHTDLPARVMDLFTNADRTFGILPHVQLGGETGLGGGLRTFYSEVAGKDSEIIERGREFKALYIYAGKNRQMGEALYLHPQVAGTRLYWRADGAYLQTDNRDATVNGAVHGDPTRLFRIERLDVEARLGWRPHAGPLEFYRRNLYIEAGIGYARRDFRQQFGDEPLLSDPGSTPQARLLSGVGKEISFYRFLGRIAYDDRDHQSPARKLLLPVNYRLPGRLLAHADGLYYFYRDLGYPERGGLFEVEATFSTGSDGVRFFRLAAEAQRFVTLFRRNRILAVRARLEKAHRIGSGTVPYPDLVALGGKQEMRGYRRGALRGEGALLVSVEYRYPIWDTWNAFLFWDEGQVFDGYGEVGMDRFRTCRGGGISFRTETGFLGKLQVGHGAAERMILGFTLEQGF